MSDQHDVTAETPKRLEVMLFPPSALFRDIASLDARVTKLEEQLKAQQPTAPAEADSARGAGLIIGALMHRLGVDEVTLTPGEMMRAPTLQEMAFWEDPRTGERHIRLPIGSQRK